MKPSSSTGKMSKMDTSYSLRKKKMLTLVTDTIIPLSCSILLGFVFNLALTFDLSLSFSFSLPKSQIFLETKSHDIQVTWFIQFCFLPFLLLFSLLFYDADNFRHSVNEFWKRIQLSHLIQGINDSWVQIKQD